MGPVCASYGVTHSHTQGVSPCHFGLCCPLLLVAHDDGHSSQNSTPLPDGLMRATLTQISLFFCLMSATLCIIVAFTDIAISCQIKRAFLLIFANRNCLINEQALICTDDHTATQLHQIAHPEMVHHIVLITEWQLLPGVVYINAARLWKGDNCGAKCCRGWQDPFLDLSGAAVIERVVPGVCTHRGRWACLHQHACTHVGTRAHTHIGRQNQPHST